MKPNPPRFFPLAGALLFGGAMGWWGGFRSGKSASNSEAVIASTQDSAAAAIKSPRTLPPAGKGEKAGATATGERLSLIGLDFRQMRKRLDAMTDSAARQAAIREALATLPVEEWQKWLKSFGEADTRSPAKADIAGMARRFTTANDLFAAIASLDPVGFMATLNSKGERNDDGESEGRLLVMMKWAELAPDAAKAFLTEQIASGHPSPGLSDSVRYTASILAQHGDAAALDWASAFPEKERGQAISAILSEMSREDPAGAAHALMANLDKIGPSTTRTNSARLAGDIANQWAQSDPAAALAWSAAQAGEIQRKAVENVMERWAEKDVDAALAALSSLPAGADAAALPALISRVPDARFPELSTRLESLPVGPARVAASERLMDRWSGQNPTAASDWMSRQPEGEVRDAAITRFIRWADVREPDAALLWAGSMSDPAKRLDAVMHVVQQLGPKAAEFVTPWLEKPTRLSAEERQQVISRMERR